MTTDLPIRVSALYRFARLDDPHGVRAPLLAVARDAGVRGTLLLAHEGVNGTIAGAPDALDRVIEHVRALPGCADLSLKHSWFAANPFHRLKVKVKRGGGNAGHNGLRSTDAHIGADFRRVRIGIGHPGHKDRVHGYVLGNYAKSEMDALADMLGAIGAETEWLAKNDDARFMNEVALRLAD